MRRRYAASRHLSLLIDIPPRCLTIVNLCCRLSWKRQRRAGVARSSQERSVGQSRIRRSELLTPPEFAGDPIVWAAWLYYEERMTQEEVAEQLGVSRASVVNFLQEARDRSIVTIAVASEHLQSV